MLIKHDATKGVDFRFVNIDLTEREKEVLSYCLVKPIFLDTTLCKSFGTIKPAKISGVGVTRGLIGQLESKGLVHCHYLDDRFGRFHMYSITEKGRHVAQQLNVQVKDCA